MKSDVIMIDNLGNGLKNALEQTEKVAQFRGIDRKQTLHLVLCTEEMLSLARSVTGEMKASFWIESEDKSFELHMSTDTVMDRTKREALLSSATSRKNEAASSLLGKLRDAFEEAMLSEEPDYNDLPDDVLNDLVNHTIELEEWDQYEQSILRKVADQVRISIRGGKVDMTVSKKYA
ncbi:MAG: hypothetical protein ILP19_06040 [Oscillospiraceae bacterium]|nr:hypothetical protein [Oscillospiraceae bacterium]